MWMAIQEELFPNVNALWGPEVKSRGEEAPGRQWLASYNPGASALGPCPGLFHAWVYWYHGLPGLFC